MKTFVIVLLTICLFGCAPASNKSVDAYNADPVATDTIRISTCYSCERLTKKWIDEYHKIHSDVHFKLNINESSSCLASLNETSDIAMISRELTMEEESAGYCVASVAKHGVVLIINEHNPYIDYLKDGVTKEAITEVFKKGTWYPVTKQEKYPLNFYYRPSRAGNTWNLLNFLDINIDNLTGKSVETESDMINAVRNDIYGLGYCSHIHAYDPETNAQVSGIKVLPIKDYYGLTHHFYDSLNLLKHAICYGRYKFHLYPTIYLTMKTKPNDENIRSFVRWIFTDAQPIVESEGYIKLGQSEIGCRIKDI